MHRTVVSYDKRYAPLDHSIEAAKQPDARLAQTICNTPAGLYYILSHLVLLALRFSVLETASRH
jgi:hypothetical protein